MSNKFSKTKLATTLSLLIGATSIAPMSLAQDQSADEEVEVITVTGMRSSIKESTRLKRDSTGVVDAISAEDIGKFPDTNLAESLQRITGVSIDRSNGEGSKVTVRGFGPDFNMVTLNGRTMPASSIPGGGGTPNSRAFDFANLASDSVKSVEVFKTSRADIASGGLGATININTGKPLDTPGTQVSVGAKAIHDTTNREGDDVTPEISGLFSWTDEDETFGVMLTTNYSKRHSAAIGAYVNQWRTSAYDGTIPQAADNIQLDNAPAIGQLYSMPSDLRYTIADRERERTNAQLTLQYRPADNLTATLDYTYSELEQYEDRAEQSIWMDTYKSHLGFDDRTVKTPVYYREMRNPGGQDPQQTRDLGLAQQEWNVTNENTSIGFNLEYEVNDQFIVTFDAHTSEAESSPDKAYGAWVNTGLGSNIIQGQGADFSRDLPTMIVDFDDCDRGMNCNDMLDPDDIGTSILDMNYAYQKTEIDQYRLDATYEFDEGSIDFGIESRSMESHSLQSLTRQTMGNWGVENPGELPEGYLSPINFANEFDDFNADGAFDQGYYGSASQIGEWAAGAYGFDFATDGAYATNRIIEEDVMSAYFQFNLSGELGGMAYNFNAGLRFEDTDLTSRANVDEPSAVAWEGNNDFNVRFAGGGKTTVSEDASYDHLLPAFNFDLEVYDDVISRFSYSKTISRPTYNNLSAAATVSGPGAPTLIPGAAPASASAGNPQLLPYESDNYDLSLEWYFDDTSYVSIGYYEKRVKNFIGTEPMEESHYDLRDATAGPRAIAAKAWLESEGLDVTDTNLFNAVAALENEGSYDEIYNQSAEYWEQEYDVLPLAEDPLMMFTTQRPVNNKEAKIDGFEMAVQHFFGDTGFGIQANYTTVDGDIGYDNNADPSQTQFALVGLSDTANVVMMYEDDALQARIAYNWRDEFLDNATYYVNEPRYVEDVYQIDFNVSYQVNEELSVFVEGINITEEDSRSYGRTEVQLWNLEELGARYSVGARYTF